MGNASQDVAKRRIRYKNQQYKAYDKTAYCTIA
jgi:hypothetical protein